MAMVNIATCFQSKNKVEVRVQQASKLAFGIETALSLYLLLANLYRLTPGSEAVPAEAVYSSTRGRSPRGLE